MKWEHFNQFFERGWGLKLRPFIESPACDSLYAYIKGRSKAGFKVLPESHQVWRAFQECPYKDLKVVWIGQDPYPQVIDGKPVADGLAFSTSNSLTLPPSLEVILEAIEEDLYGGLNLYMSTWPELSEWAQDGVLLLNSSLTTEVNNPGAHKGRWKEFYHYLITEILNKENTGLVFILMGADAQELEALIDQKLHHVLTCEHPAYALRQKRKFRHQGVFSRCNQILKDNNGIEIEWARPLPF